MPIAEPWRSFFSELDPLLTGPTQLNCIGGFALTICYGMARQTADVDVVTVTPSDHRPDLQALAGEGSPLHHKHRVYIQQVGVASLPFDFESRLRPIAAGPLIRHDNTISLWMEMCWPAEDAF